MLDTYAFDIETVSLETRPEHHRLTALMKEGESDIVLMDWDETQAWLDSNHVLLIGHNIVGFDLEFFRYDPEQIIVWDTFLMSKMLNRDPGFLHSLDACLKRIGIVHTEKGIDVAAQDWDIHSLTQQQMSYIRQDVANLFPLYHSLKDWLTELELLDNCRFEHRVRKISNIMERNGLPIHQHNLFEKKQEAKRAIPHLDYNVNSYQQVSDQILGCGSLVREQRIEQVKEAGIKIKQHKTTGRVYMETHAEALQRCLMAGINTGRTREIIDAKKAAAPLKHIKWAETELEDNHNHFHSRYDNLGTTTGRYAASGYAIQQMNKNLRTCFGYTEAEPFVIVKADWSQMELRLHAALNHDPEMTAILEDTDADIHSITAGRAFGSTTVTEEQRNLGKTANFSLLYMAGWRRLWGRLIKEGNYVSAAVAEQLWHTFHNQFPTVRACGDAVTAEANINFPDNFPVRIWGGLIRWVSWGHDSEGLWHFPLPAVMNCYIQGAGGAVLKRALLMLPFNIQQCLAGTVHDEILLCCHEKDAENYAHILKSCMELSLADALKPTKIPPKVDVQIGKTWGG